MVIALAVVALVVTGVAGWRWWTHPTAFNDPGISLVSHPRPLADAATSTTVVLPKIRGSAESIEIRDLDAAFSINTAEAEATFWVCHMTSTEDPIGAVRDPESVCGDIEAFTPPMMFDYGVMPDSDYLFVTITPTQKGTAHLTSVDIDYRRSGGHAFQRGSQSIEVNLRITAR